MLKKGIALLVFTFAMNVNGANMTLMDTWRSLDAYQAAGMMADDCALPLRLCEWEQSEADFAGDNWILVADRNFLDIYRSASTEGRFGVVMSKERPSVVPLPAAGWLFMSALAAIGLIGRKRSVRG